RSTWLAAHHPRLPQHFVLAQVKNNIAPPQPSLIYSLDGPADGFPVLRWHGPCPLAADEMHHNHVQRTRRERACEFLEALLKSGPKTSRDVWTAARQHRLGRRTLQRAQEELGIRCIR